MNINNNVNRNIQETLKRLNFFVLIVLACVIASVLFNFVLANIKGNESGWVAPTLFPVLNPIGSDFREGLYRPADALLQGKDPYLDANLIYPPLAAYAGIPFTFTSEWRAYLVQVALIILLNLASLYLLAEVGTQVFLDGGGEGKTVIFLSSLICISIFSFSSYGFSFNVERGNFDVYPLFLSVLFLWLLWKYPKRMWLQILVISVAAHLKVYPLVFFVLILWKHGWKSILPTAVINVLFLLCLGPGDAWIFLQNIFFQQGGRVPTWIGNHSSFAYAAFWYWQPEQVGVNLYELFFLLLPCLVWAAALIVLFKRGFSLKGAVWLFALSIPLVNLIPRVSYDYKLIWLYPAALLLLIYQLKSFAIDKKRMALAAWLFLALLLLMISRSFAITPDILANKYPYILMVEIMIAVTAITDRSTLLPSTESDRDAVVS